MKMKMYVVRYEDAEQETTIRSEFISKQEQIDKVNWCSGKGFKILDVFECEM